MYANFRRQLKIKIDASLNERTANGWGVIRTTHGKIVRKYFSVAQKRFLKEIGEPELASIRMEFFKNGYFLLTVVIVDDGVEREFNAQPPMKRGVRPPKDEVWTNQLKSIRQ